MNLLILIIFLCACTLGLYMHLRKRKGRNNKPELKICYTIIVILLLMYSFLSPTIIKCSVADYNTVTQAAPIPCYSSNYVELCDPTLPEGAFYGKIRIGKFLYRNCYSYFTNVIEKNKENGDN